jgi:hypothetical protein
MWAIRLSTRKNKKYDIFYNGRWIPFGDSRYEHYMTNPLIPPNMRIYPEHRDLKRRDEYRKRASKIRDRDGNLTYLDKNSPNYWAYHLLW